MRIRVEDLRLATPIGAGAVALGLLLTGYASPQTRSDGTVSGTWAGRYADIKGGVYAVTASLNQRGQAVTGTVLNPVRHVLEHGRIASTRVTWTITFPSVAARLPSSTTG